MEDLIGLGQLGVKILDVCEKATGGALKPRQIKRVAEAEAEARLIEAKAEAKARQIEAKAEAKAERTKVLARQDTQIELARRQQAFLASAGVRASQEQLAETVEGRALLSMAHREVRGQRNLERIAAKALLEANATPDDQVSDEPVSEDWLATFFEHCRQIGDEDMQTIWARVLAGETARPGSFHPRTIQFLKTIEKKEAELFSDLCRYVLFYEDAVFPFLLSPTLGGQLWQDPAFLQMRRTTAHFDSVGLLGGESYPSVKDLADKVYTYGPHRFRVVAEEGSKGAKSLKPTSRVHLSLTGYQLFKISGAEHREDYFRHIVDVQFPGEGFTVEILEGEAS